MNGNKLDAHVISERNASFSQNSQNVLHLYIWVVCLSTGVYVSVCLGVCGALFSSAVVKISIHPAHRTGQYRTPHTSM